MGGTNKEGLAAHSSPLECPVQLYQLVWWDWEEVKVLICEIEVIMMQRASSSSSCVEIESATSDIRSQPFPPTLSLFPEPDLHLCLN